MARTSIEIPEAIRKGVLYAHGSARDREVAEKLISALPLTGDERNDRMLIQDAIDAHRIRAAILYNGNTVWAFDKYVREYRRLKRSNDLTRMTKGFYEFLIYACDDIAHYDYGGYIAFYDEDFGRVDREIIQRARVPGWKSDVQHILDTIQI